MSEITLENLGHSYAGGAYALKPLNMTWADGRTYALLGPSGCGKSTMLNIISGILRPTEGRVLFDGQDVTAKGIGQRNIAQVFQVPVIYKSMTVADNLAFPLVCRRMPQAAIHKRVTAIAERLGLAPMLKRSANALTADQKQLISLGRGLVRDDVSAILLDEPLTVIDPQMKFELRKILKEINAEFKITMVLVTHDQTEAMTFADTVVVMNHGEVIQAGGPQELFDRPATNYIGYFIGSPPMNFIPAEKKSGQVQSAVGLAQAAPVSLNGGELVFGFRPEHLTVTGPGQALRGKVERIWFEGLDQVVELSSGASRFRARLPDGIGTVGQDLTLHLPDDRLRLYCNDKLVV